MRIVPDKAVVYGIVSDSKFLYIGASHNPERALKIVERGKRPLQQGDKLYLWFFNETVSAFLFEAKMIKKFNPPLNKQKTGVSILKYKRIPYRKEDMVLNFEESVWLEFRIGKRRENVTAVLVPLNKEMKEIRKKQAKLRRYERKIKELELKKLLKERELKRKILSNGF